MSDPSPRIPQITEADRTDEVRAMFAAMAGLSPDSIDGNHVLKTFAHYPALTLPFLQFNRHLLGSSLVPVRLRQIAILRTAWVRRATYMWASHLRMSLRLGLQPQDFEAVKRGAHDAHWSETERTIIEAVDQLCERSDLDDAHWQALSRHFDRREMMDFLFTIGAYVLLAGVMNAIRIQREPELRELAEKYGTP